MVEFLKFDATPTLVDRTIQLDDGTDVAATGIMYGGITAGDNRHTYRDDVTFNLSPSVYSIGTTAKQAWGVDGGTTVRVSVDGGNTLTDTPVGFVPKVYSTLRFGAQSAANAKNLNGYIKNVSIWDLPATVTNVERLSA